MGRNNTADDMSGCMTFAVVLFFITAFFGGMVDGCRNPQPRVAKPQGPTLAEAAKEAGKNLVRGTTDVVIDRIAERTDAKIEKEKQEFKDGTKALTDKAKGGMISMKDKAKGLIPKWGMRSDDENSSETHQNEGEQNETE